MRFVVLLFYVYWFIDSVFVHFQMQPIGMYGVVSGIYAYLRALLVAVYMRYLKACS